MSGSDSSFANPVKFVGGMNVPSQLGGRLNATVPCAVLMIDEATVRIHPRLFVSAMFSDFEVPLGEITAAFRLRGTFMTAGVGFELSDGQLAYFWTLGDQEQILSVLRQRGIQIDPVPRRAQGALSGQFGLLWKTGGRSTPSVAKMPGYSQPVKRLMPLFIVAGIAVIVIFASMGGPFGWFVAALGVVGVVRSVVVWRRHRDL